MDAKNLIVVADKDENEALYLCGNLIETEGDTVYAIDIADAAGDDAVNVSRINVDWAGVWPQQFAYLMPHVVSRVGTARTYVATKMSHDQSVRDVVDGFLSDCESEKWFASLQDGVKEWFANEIADCVQREIESHLEHGRPVFKRYNRPDDVNWAGWYEVNGTAVGHLGLDKKFVPVKAT